ncbi:MAG: hypothetical protein ACFFEJ_08845 [Candidatus Thorarchaeota archaeon]
MKTLSKQDIYVPFVFILIVIGIVVSYNVAYPFIPVEDISYSGPTEIEDLEGQWYQAGPFEIDMNGSYAVRLCSVIFTFLTYEVPDVLDVPYQVNVSVKFEDGTIEPIGFWVGGYGYFGSRVFETTHSSPSAAIITHVSHTDWYAWYYLVSA